MTGSADQPRGAETTPPVSARTYRADALLSLLGLRWFIRLRWGFIFVALAVLAIEAHVFPTTERPHGLLLVLLGMAVVNLIWVGVSRFLLSRARAEARPGQDPNVLRGGQVFANVQVATDLLALTLILRYTGGVENPMAVFYLFHMAIGSLVLRRWQALVQGLWAVGLYTTVGVGELVGRISPHYLFLPGLAPAELYLSSQYVCGVIVVITFAVAGTLYFMLQIASRLDEGERRLRQANKALQLSQKAIQDLQHRRSRFMQTAAHQLKSPLAGIQTLTGLIRDKVVPPEAIRPTCERIMRRCHDGIEQVTGLISFARVQEADPARHRESLACVGKTLKDLFAHFRPMAQEKNITLHCNLPADFDAGGKKGEPLLCHVDPTDLDNCLGNLIENAIKYTPGPGTVTVTVARGGPRDASSAAAPAASEQASGREGAFLTVSVSDTGMGIDPKLLGDRSGPGGPGTMFDAFRRGEQALAAGIPGTGLGLSIVQEVVEQAGGRIQVRSRPGEGSTFTVSFPAHRMLPEGPTVRDTRSSEIVIEHPQPEDKQPPEQG